MYNCVVIVVGMSGGMLQYECYYVASMATKVAAPVENSSTFSGTYKRLLTPHLQATWSASSTAKTVCADFSTLVAGM